MMFKDTVIFEEHRKFLKVCYSLCNVDSFCIFVIGKMKPESEVSESC